MEVSEFELRPVNLHWLEEVDPHDDCCVHGGVYLKIGDKIVSDGEDEWTVSTAAFRLLNTITNEHKKNIDEAIIPCCGFTMWLDESASDGLCIPNCNNGIDWKVLHPEPNVVMHTFSADTVFYTERRKWSRAVCEFSDQVRDYLSTAWPKNFCDETDRRGFELFMRLWDERRRVAELINAGGNHI